MRDLRSQIPGWEVVALVAVMVLAIALRTWHLGDVPPGLTHDEASNGHDAAAVLRGVRPIYFTVGYGHEPLYPYSVALSMALLGTTELSLRLTTVFWGSVLILLSYLLARTLFGPMPALIAAALMAVSFWCVMTSRVGLRAVTAATTFTASAYAFWRASSLPLPASKNRRSKLGSGFAGRPGHLGGNWLWWVASGACLGASIYTYMASRAMPAVYVLLLAYLVALDVLGRLWGGDVISLSGEREMAWAPSFRVGGSTQPPWRRQAVGVALLLFVAAIVAAPLVRFLMTHPEAEQRLEQLSAPINDALRGRFGGLWYRVSHSLPMFTVRGDPLWLYNIPGRPLLGAVAGSLFYAGLFVCLWHWRDPRYVFLLLWLLVGAAPALATGPDATALRSITAQPVLFIIAAVGLTTVVRFLRRRCGQWGRVVTPPAVAALLLMTGVRTVHAYFGVWAQDQDVRVAYHHALVEQARYLDARAEDGSVAFSSIYPGRFHDPYTMELSLRRSDLSLHWFDGRHALVFPAGAETRVVIPTIAPLDERLLPLFMPHASLLNSEHLRPDDLITRFDVYRFDAEDAWAALLPPARENPVFWSPADAFPHEGPRSAYEPLDLPVNLGGVLDLMGYDLETPTVEPGGEVVLLTAWRIRSTFQHAQDVTATSELVAFSHALDAAGNVVGQMDRLDVPSWQWRPGDAFVQLHRFPLEADVPAGSYSVEVGVYAPEGSGRLPIVVGDAAIDDRVLLRPLEVAGP